MFKIESYVTPILLSYVDKYVRDFKPADAQVSLWGGGVALHNLVLKADVLQQEVALPFTLVSGRIHELLIQVPWTKIMSEPIVVTIDTIECVLSLHPPAASDESLPPESPSRKPQVVEAPPGYMQALVRRIVSNISLRVHHLIVKYVQDDIVLSLNVKHLSVESAGLDWQPSFADIDQTEPVIRRLVRLDDLTLCLDRADSDGKIRFYQEPLLYRCQLDLRVLTRLVSANTRRASNLSVQLRSSKLAWGVTSEQLTLLLRLLRERAQIQITTPPPAPKLSATNLTTPMHATSSNSAEPVRSESWSEWAWSWLPTWMDKEGGVEEATLPPTPIPIFFTAYFDHVSLVFKVLETEGGSRKRARGVLELSAAHAAARAALCAPTALRVRCGARALRLASHGKCVCGMQNLEALNDKPTIYLDKKNAEEEKEPWTWPAETLECKVELAEAAEEECSESPNRGEFARVSEVIEQNGTTFDAAKEDAERKDDEDLWRLMSPVVFLEYSHVRSPPTAISNPYDSPPVDFQYSDWEEDNNLKINIKPLDIRLCMGLIHRLSAVKTIFQELPPVPIPDIPMRTLTVEECEALFENLPQRRMNINVQGLRVRMIPWDHSLTEKPTLAPLVLDVEVPQARLTISLPLYPHRVCSAACQMPKDEGPLWQGARLHVSATLSSIEARLCSPGDSPPRPVARADLRAVLHVLLHPEMFARRDTVNTSYSVKIHELNTCGSAARLQAAWQVVESLIARRPSLLLRYTELSKDALNDEESVAIDATIEDFSVRGFITRQINTHIMMVQSARVMAFHSPSEGKLKQAWLFSAPDLSTSTSFLRVAVQWCEEQFEDSLDYIGVWSEPMAACVDPLFIAWLGYKPQVKATSESLIGSKSSSQFYLRRRATPPSSSGRGASRTGSGSELVHAVRPRSGGSSSEPGEPRTVTQPQPVLPRQSLLLPERLLQLHARLQRMLVSVELGMALLYFTASSASAVDCATLRDAMERHAAVSHHVLAFSLGKVTFSSNVMMKYLWNDIRHDGPTLRTQPPEENQEKMDSFPWKLRLGDVSCYTVEAREIVDSGRERATGLRSQLKIPSGAVKTRTVLEPVTTTVTLSVVTKTMQIRSWTKPQQDQKTAGHTPDETRMKYFTTGVDFKPSTLKEFVRGPSKRRKPSVDPQPQDSKHEPTETTIMGPVVSIGVHLHADTPPVTVRLEQDQVHTVAAAVHCLRHLQILMHRAPLILPRQYSSQGSSHRSLIRSVSELDEQQTPSDENLSETRSELVPIFESRGIPEVKLRKFFWFQWVVGRATLVVASDQVKLAFEVDDIISTIDLQEHYNQLKVKVASASVRHHKKNSNDEWTAGVLGGRVLEAREPTEAIEENHFLAVTITQAQISTLPESWKEELNPKLVENKSGVDSMWEIYATLAPLEAVLQPDVLENILSLYQEMSPPSFCPLQTETEQRNSAWQWPFCYVTAGGLRLLVTTEHKEELADDTFLFIVGKISVTPYPENPICRRAVTGGTDSGWAAGAGSLEGRQYEVYIKNVAIQSAQFNQIVQQETSEMHNLKGAGSENPAVKWTQPPVSPIVTPILHAVEINCVIAPALYIGGGLACGPALELNLASDCAVELSVEQIILAHHVVADAKKALSSSYESFSSLDNDIFGVCPYAPLVIKQKSTNENEFFISSTVLHVKEEETTTPVGFDRSFAADSGVDINTSKSSRLLFDPTSIPKKSVSIAFIEDTANPSDYLEIFVTMGMIELSLYVEDDNSPEIVALRPPSNASVSVSTDAQLTPSQERVTVTSVEDPQESNSSKSRSRSLTDTIRHADIGQTKLDLNEFHDLADFMNGRRRIDGIVNYYLQAVLPHARKCEGNLPLLHLTLHQPNLYYWKKKTQCNLQVSLFNAWIGLGAGEVDGFWGEAILSTAKGVPDPVTDIPPALATVKVVVPSTGSTPYSASSTGSCKGTVTVDIERPVLLEVSGEKLRRLKLIIEMIKSHMKPLSTRTVTPDIGKTDEIPVLLKLRKFMVQRSFESITIKASQVGVSGCEGTLGWDSASLQVAAGLRSERLAARAHVAALLAAAGPPADTRHLLMQPLMLGLELESTCEAWRRVEGGASAQEPCVHLAIDLDRVTIDVRPEDLAAFKSIKQTLEELYGEKPPPLTTESADSIFTAPQRPDTYPLGRGVSASSLESTEVEDHYYKDDLKSGAFKIVTGGQLPMAYQVMLYGDTVSWRYPHPRTITRITVNPIPDVDEEVNCVLELYNSLLRKWEPHTYIKLPVAEPREINIYVPPPDVVFAIMWRIRAHVDNDKEEPPFEFQIDRFLPRDDPLTIERGDETPAARGDAVSAEQLWSALRVDSYFAPRLLPRMRVALRCTELELHLHNSLPNITSQATALEGYYVSRPLMRSHRVLSLVASDATAHALLGSPAGRLLLLDAKLLCDVLECSTGALEQAVGATRLRAAVSAPGGGAGAGAGAAAARARACCDAVRVALHVPRLRTLRALADDWQLALQKYKDDTLLLSESDEDTIDLKSRTTLGDATAAALEGRVSLWLHNSCASALRVGQEGTDELVPLGPGARLAYRWRSPAAPLRLRFALAGPAADWRWSTCLSLSPGACRVRLEDAEALGGAATPGGGVYLHARVATVGARRQLLLAGRLVLANALRRSLLYKVRARCADAKAWRSVCSGELDPESVGRSVLCGADCEMVLKIKFTSQDTGWSGDIPLKECPKENVPWLVKVPSGGETAYVSVWCRVVRARSDGRVLAAVWPLYVLYSHLPLDTDVLVTTETEQSRVELSPAAERPPPLVQGTPGRGACTHLLAPGTTAARHQLSFQYKDLECPVTREAIPLHYGVTDTSVFDKRAPVNNIDEVIEDIRAWFERSGRGVATNWPYSTVASHWPGVWKAASLQPRSDVTVRYGAVRAGGGCSLEIRLSPVVLLCNAAPLPLTLRAHDAAPLCKVEPGAAISAPSAVLAKAFFMSVEIGRETFVSSQLQVWGEEPGRYGAPPRGCVALDHAAAFAIQCNHKVALLTLHYEIKEDINVLGVTPTFMLINRLNMDLMVSAIAVPVDSEKEAVLRPKSYKVVKPTKEESLNGEPLSRFWLSGRWRGGEASELRTFLCLALPESGSAPAPAPAASSAAALASMPAPPPAPVALGRAPGRRAIHLIDENNKSTAVVVVQQKHEGRWVVTVAPDPCPQFVVHNRTSHVLAIAEPLRAGDSQPTFTQVLPECAGARWWCAVAAGALAHYSTPAHCARFPPPPPPDARPPQPIPFIAIGRATSYEVEPEWSAGVAAAGGEQLVQLAGGVTVKLRAHPHPHSTLLELQDVDQNDISASDIRRRLQGPFFPEESMFARQSELSAKQLERINADDTLLQHVEDGSKRDSLRKLSMISSRTLELALEPAIEPALDPAIDPIPPEGSEELAQLLPENNLEDTRPSEQMEVPERLENAPTHFLSGDVRQPFHYDPNPDNLPSPLAAGSPEPSFALQSVCDSECGENNSWSTAERLRCVIGGIAIEMAATPDVKPLFALHIDRAAILLQSDSRGTNTVLSIADVQMDNLQYESGQYDFGVVASTRAAPLARDEWPPLWSAFAARGAFASRRHAARLLLRLRHDRWRVVTETFSEMTEVELSVGPLALYVEDGYVAALAQLARSLAPPAPARPAPARPAAAAAAAAALAEARALVRPLRLRALHLHPLDLTLTLHTAVRMYIALDQSPLRLSAFQLEDMMTSTERLTHALTVHYLSAAILGAGWVVGGLELLGAPGALAARVGGATGGVRGVATAAAAALLRSLSAWAGSLARNLDLLAGDEEHARRAAAARRRPPDSFVAGLAAGITNFAINILGAVGGLAHHPLVGVAVGETESGAAALRRGLVGALAKPLSATADLLALAGTGLLRQTGWDPVPQPRAVSSAPEGAGGWRRDCVRWAFRLAELAALAGYDVLLDGAPLRLLLTHKFLVVADPESERIVEMIDLHFCSLGPFQGAIVELIVTQRRQKEKVAEARLVDEDDEYQISAAAMARVARYTGAEGAAGAAAAGEARVLALLPAPRRAPALHAALAAAIHHNADSHLHLL